jgi:hypothetical protein
MMNERKKEVGSRNIRIRTSNSGSGTLRQISLRKECPEKAWKFSERSLYQHSKASLGYRHRIGEWWKKCQLMVGKAVCPLSFPHWKACRERF